MRKTFPSVKPKVFLFSFLGCCLLLCVCVCRCNGLLVLIVLKFLHHKIMAHLLSPPTHYTSQFGRRTTRDAFSFVYCACNWMPSKSFPHCTFSLFFTSSSSSNFPSFLSLGYIYLNTKEPKSCLFLCVSTAVSLSSSC